MIETAPAAPWLRSAEQLPGREREIVSSGWKQHLKAAAPRPTTRGKMFGRTAITSRPTPHQMGGHNAKPRPHRAGTRSTTRSKTSGQFFGKLRHAPPTSHGGGTSGLTPPSGVGKTGAARWEIAAPTTSARSQGPSRGQDFGGPDDGCRGSSQVEFGPVPGWRRPGRTNRMYLFFCVLFSFPLFGGHGGKEYGMPHYDGKLVRGRERL